METVKMVRSWGPHARWSLQNNNINQKDRLSQNAILSPIGMLSPDSSFQSLLYRTDDFIQAHVLSFPGEYCASVAMGCFVDDRQRTLFCKDRHSTEAKLQQVGSHFGALFSRAFMTGNPIVAWSECIQRPTLEELPPHSVGAHMWHLKEQQWQEQFGRNDDDDSNDSSSSRSSMATAPSEMHCWLLEEAVQYYDRTTATLNESTSTNSVDASLRRKLRLAADRSPSGCLDIVALLMLTEISQSHVTGPQPEWPDYCKTHLLVHPEDSLTADETEWLLQEKLKGPDIQMAMLYATIVGLPDCHCGNMAVQESIMDDDDSSLWRLRIVHFDTGILSVQAGVSLESLKLAYDDETDGVDYGQDFDFLGGAAGRAYYYPILFTFEAADDPIHDRVREGLLRLDGTEFDRIAQLRLKDPDLFDPGLHGIGRIFQARVDRMKNYVRQYPQCSCKQLAFETIRAWKRDFEINNGGEEFVRWIHEVQQWANSHSFGH